MSAPAATEPFEVVMRDDGAWVCEFGSIDFPNTAIHESVGHAGPCIHAVATLPGVTVVCAQLLASCHWQPVIYRQPYPIIASRRGDLLTLAVHRFGPLKRKGQHRHSPAAKLSPDCKWTYRLHPMRWGNSAHVSKCRLAVLQP